MPSWVAGACFVVAVFVVFFFHVGIGMTAGETAANKFLLIVLAAGAMIAAGTYVWRRWVNKEP